MKFLINWATRGEPAKSIKISSPLPLAAVTFWPPLVCRFVACAGAQPWSDFIFRIKNSVLNPRIRFMSFSKLHTFCFLKLASWAIKMRNLAALLLPYLASVQSQPTIISVTPDSGSKNGGTRLTIYSFEWKLTNFDFFEFPQTKSPNNRTLNR